MTLIIFSCNRALQLQTLLISLSTYLTIEEPYSIHVLYAASDEFFAQGYEQLMVAYSDVQFHQERRQRKWTWPLPGGYWKNLYRYLRQASLRRTSDFKSLTEQIISSSQHEGVMFLTDDSLFTRPVCLDATRLKTVLDDADNSYSFSCRHGLSLQPLPTGVTVFDAGGYRWTIDQANQTNLSHWTWRFSVDGHVYPRRALLPILHRLHYANPNSLEGFVNEFISNVRPDLFRTLLFDENPSLVGFMLNKVQTYNSNRSFNVSTDMLNEKMLAGYRLYYHYKQPVTDFQPELESIELRNSHTGHSEHLPVSI